MSALWRAVSVYGGVLPRPLTSRPPLLSCSAFVSPAVVDIHARRITRCCVQSLLTRLVSLRHIASTSHPVPPLSAAPHDVFPVRSVAVASESSAGLFFRCGRRHVFPSDVSSPHVTAVVPALFSHASSNAQQQRTQHPCYRGWLLAATHADDGGHAADAVWRAAAGTTDASLHAILLACQQPCRLCSSRRLLSQPAGPRCGERQEGAQEAA